MIATDDRIDLVENEEIDPDRIDNPPSASSSPARSHPRPTRDGHELSSFNVSPIDRLNFVYIVFYILGIITMTPWNFFITAESYWMFKFRNTTARDNSSEPELTSMQRSFTCDLTLTASLSGTIILVLHAFYGQKVSHRLKIVGCLATIFIMFVLTTMFVNINTDKWQEQFFLITLCTVLLLNVSSAVICGAIFSLAALFPSHYMTPIVSGQAFGGIISALIYILIIAFRASPTETALVYFIIASVLALISMLCYLILEKSSFFRYFSNMGVNNNTTQISEETDNIPSNNSQSTECSAVSILHKIYTHAASICLLYTITVSIYPSVAILMQSIEYGHGKLWNDVYYMSVVNYLLFNSCDYFGRILSGIFDKAIYETRTILLMVIMRVIYVPLFLCSNSSLHKYLPTIIHSDTVFIIMMASFAASNGYITNTLITSAPRKVKQQEKEMASAIMAASLSCGNALGSVFSMILVQMI